MEKRKNLARLAIQVALFAVAFYAMGWILSALLFWVAGALAGPTFSMLFSALFATWVALRIYEDRPISAVGLWWNTGSAVNLKWGLLGGGAAAVLALAPPLLTGAAHIVRDHPPSGGGIVFALFCVAAGSAGEEILFRGYGLQLLMGRLGPWAAIVPLGVLFGLMHAGNPDSSPLGLVNTAGFGILFGYAYHRSRDLWFPIGLHFGWNVTLPVFGADLSGLKIFKEITGHELTWSAGALWSGGAYGPEASILTTAALIPLFLFLWKAPVRRQTSPLADSPAEAPCEATPQLPPS
jgi:uncharacterized protein